MVDRRPVEGANCSLTPAPKFLRNPPNSSRIPGPGLTVTEQFAPLTGRRPTMKILWCVLILQKVFMGKTGTPTQRLQFTMRHAGCDVIRASTAGICHVLFTLLFAFI